ncbi:MAG: alpha-glucan family phosphorylase, partial [Spirochaetia bacterium]
EEFLKLGRENPEDGNEEFCMTVLALKMSAYNNGVSKLHGDISRDMWERIWPKVPRHEVPITHITNGVHTRTWIGHNMLDLLDRYFGPKFNDEPEKLSIWERMSRISDEELWRTHERRRERLVAFVRDRLRMQMKRRGASQAQVEQAENLLSPYALTISFARRFATYKRATLLFRDTERLMRLLTDTQRPIQLIFAGKAHPHDIPGKNLIKDIVHFASNPEVRSKVVFLEDYDMNIAKYLISGSDVWLNTPRRPMEASGTSGMKAALNGVLNCSIPDGWWAEAYEPSLGWSIGHGEEYDDEDLQDEIESKALYDTLEREILPVFYNRGRDNLPRTWITMMKESMKTAGARFSSHRMLTEYAESFYYPALKNHKKFSKNNFAISREIAVYIDHLKKYWKELQIAGISCSAGNILKIGDEITVKADVLTSGLSTDEIKVELYYGPVDSTDNISNAERTEMSPDSGKSEDKKCVFSATVTCRHTGRQGYAVRILPKHPHLVHPFLPGFIKWG